MTTYLAGQGLDYVNPDDTRVHADIGISDWGGDPMMLDDGESREVVPVAPRVRDYIIQQKKLAAARVAATPVLGALKTTWSELETASKPIRDRRAAEREQEKWEPGSPIAARDQRARAELRDVVTAPVRAKLEALAELEQTVRTELDDPPSWRPTAEDMAAVLNLGHSLSLLTPQYAIPILMRQLVLDPATRGKGQGRVTALLPIVQSLVQRDAVERDRRGLDEYGYASYAVQDIITQAKAVQRDASYDAAHQTLRAIDLARYKLGVLASDYAASMGVVGGTRGWFAEFGMPALKETEPLAPYLGQLT